MIRRFPIVIAATTLALSLTASASMLGDGQLGQVAEQLKTALQEIRWKSRKRLFWSVLNATFAPVTH